MLIFMLGLPGVSGGQVVRQIGLPVIVFFPLATMLVCKLFQDYDLKARHNFELRSSEERFRSFLRHSPVMTSLCNLDGTYLYVNEALSKTLALSPDQLEGRSFDDVLPESIANQFRERINRVADSQAVLSVEDHLASPQGERHYLTTLFPLLDAERRVCSVGAIAHDITERRRAEDALRASEELQRTTLASIGDAVITTDADGRVTMMNPVAEHLTGWQGAEATGKPIEEVFRIENAKTRKPVENPLKEVVATGMTVGLANHTVLIARDSSEHQIADSAAPIRKAGGDILGAVLVFRDVTEQYAVAERLRRSESDLQQAQWVARIGSWRFDLDRGEVTASDVARQIYGIDDRDLTIAYVQSIPVDQERKRLDDAIRELVEQGKDYDIEFRIRRPSDGDVRDIHSVAEYDENNHAIIGTIQDITERKEAERALRRSESLFQTMLSLIPDMISIHDPDMNIVYSNWNGFASVAPEKRIPGEKCYRIYRGLDAVCPDCKARQVLQTREPYAEELELPEGRWVNLHVIPILGADGECELFEEWVRDITERKETEDRLRQVEKMDAIGQLAGGVAHDFNNQLGGIMGYADLLSMRLESDELKRYAENILACTRRAGDLTQKLLNFARKGQYQSIPVDMHEIIHDVVEFLNHSLDKKIVMKQILTANPCTTKGDPTQLQNALLNLAINAADAMSDGGELIFETTTLDLDEDYCASVPYIIHPGPYLQVSMTDTGHGIPKNDLDHIFEPFFTTKEVGKGTGMGLAAVYGTVKQSHGAINVYSEVDHGTTFRLYLPLETEGVRSTPRAEEAVRATRDSTILVVDDEQVIRDLAEDMLCHLGYRVVVRETGKAGLDYFRDHWQGIDLVILDMVMPRMNGSETFRAMKAIQQDVKVLLASGYSAGGMVNDLLAEGVRGFIQKPFSRAALSSKVAACLEPERAD